MDFTFGMPQSGKSIPTVLSRSGRILVLVSAVALQVSRCSRLIKGFRLERFESKEAP